MMEFRDEAISVAHPLAKGLREHWLDSGGGCPETLRGLVPKYLDEVPVPPTGIHYAG
ncbi:hypothetical protein IIA16_02025 [bacterium]|nr:hypothetical protein [bacterium]